jgi:hypothetical protein
VGGTLSKATRGLSVISTGFAEAVPLLKLQGNGAHGASLGPLSISGNCPARTDVLSSACAVQDTLRVYKQEINVIEVELLGREQQERIEQDRAVAEASGLAQLQRLQEQALQTRIRFNRAKQHYHFPPPFGYK